MTRTMAVPRATVPHLDGRTGQCDGEVASAHACCTSCDVREHSGPGHGVWQYEPQEEVRATLASPRHSWASINNQSSIAVRVSGGPRSVGSGTCRWVDLDPLTSTNREPISLCRPGSPCTEDAHASRLTTLSSPEGVTASIVYKTAKHITQKAASPGSPSERYEAHRDTSSPPPARVEHPMAV